MAISVSWELVEGQPCCCGDAACDGGWADRWTWIARSTDSPSSCSGETTEQARAGLEFMLRCKSEGRVPSAREMRAVTA